jgi:hypothetical protein
LIDKNTDITDELVEELIRSNEPVPTVTEVHIQAVDLTCYDQLLQEVA